MCHFKGIVTHKLISAIIYSKYDILYSVEHKMRSLAKYQSCFFPYNESGGVKLQKHFIKQVA